jgi:ATP synthase subunit 6
MLFSPLEQFEIHSLIPFPIPFTFTNSSLLLLITLLVISFLYLSLESHRTLVPSRWQLCFELFYQYVLSIVHENLGHQGLPFFPFLFSLFSYLILLNLLGMIPYSFAVTSHLIVTFGLSLSIWFGVLSTGFARHKLNYFSMFMPHGAPLLLAPLLVMIELLSYIARAVSLGVRLAANITSGHILLAIISSFAWTMLLAGGFIGFAAFIPIIVLLFLTVLELAVALVQAYVFTLLTAIYINDGLNLH